MTLPSSQGYLVPAQENAMKRLVSAGMKSRLLSKSSLTIFCLNPILLSPGLGSENRKNVTRSATPPIGRLIQKHHRQPSDCVRDPPIMGAAIMARFSTPPKTPQKIGRRRSGRICVRIVYNPPRIPPKPTPVTALPATNMVDVVAVEQSKDPTKSIALASMNMRLTEKSLYSLPNMN